MSSVHKRVAAVVVTYNRKALLQECLDAILAQSHPVSKNILIDNASTDGTEESLRENGYLDNPMKNDPAGVAIEYRLMSQNLGGPGGFYEGLKAVKGEGDIDWAWTMDDDTIPTKTCLENLLKADDRITDTDFSKEALIKSAVANLLRVW